MVKEHGSLEKYLESLKPEKEKMKTSQNDPAMEREPTYFDKNGNEIREFDLIKVFHFKGTNDQGRGRKNYYMYKWIRLVESQGKLYWAAYHLNDATDSLYWLKATTSQDRVQVDSEIVQSAHRDRYISK